MGNFMKNQAIELDAQNSQDCNRDGVDEHSSCGDILSKGTEVKKHRGGSGTSE